MATDRHRADGTEAELRGRVRARMRADVPDL